MGSKKHDTVLAQKAMDKLLLDLLSREEVFGALGVNLITYQGGNRPSWYLWTEDNQGVYQLELQDVGQVLCDRQSDAKPFLEMEADFVLRYLPFSEIQTEATAGRNSRMNALPGIRMSGAA